MTESTVLAVLLVIATALVIGSIAARYQTVTVYEFQRGLRYGNGRFEALVEPGRYRIWRPTTKITTVDVRSTLTTVAGQELESNSGNTFVLGTPAGITPLPVERSAANPALSEDA